MASTEISVIILTHNEAENIAECIESVSWSDDVIVVDSGSDDDTVGVARGARADVRILENPFTDFGQQRNWALDHSDPKHQWILFLDADERITPALRDEMASAIASPDSVGYFLCYRNIFLGRWLKRCTFFPSWQLRLLKRGQVRYQKAGHGQREVADGPLGFLTEPYDHFGFSKGIAAWIDRHNRYSTEEAKYFIALAAEPLQPGDLLSRDAVVRRRAIKRIYARMPARPLVRFLYTYVFRLGFLDGRAGWTFCQLQFAHELNISAKQRECGQSEAGGSHHRAPVRDEDPGAEKTAAEVEAGSDSKIQ